jgi:hypothetical protein
VKGISKQKNCEKTKKNREKNKKNCEKLATSLVAKNLLFSFIMEKQNYVAEILE